MTSYAARLLCQYGQIIWGRQAHEEVKLIKVGINRLVSIAIGVGAIDGLRIGKCVAA